MTQITTKELSGLSDLLTVETNMVAKCRAYAAETSDGELKTKYNVVILNRNLQVTSVSTQKSRALV